MTFSIVARDPDSGQMGVATQTNAFAVGSSVPWAMPGYGVIATQSVGEPMYGELGLEALRAGLTAGEALTALRSVDPYPDRRQVAMVDGYGGVDVYTGDTCVPAAGHAQGPGCAALANMMATTGVWDTMVEAYADASGPLVHRLLAALRAADERGGDLRGSRSAAVLIVRASRSGRPWRDRVVDLRVDDHPEPLAELERMVAYNARYHDTVAAFELALEGRGVEAFDRLEDDQVDPSREPDLTLWRAIVLAQAGRSDDARRLFEQLEATDASFVETARRFRDVGLVDRAALDRILPADDAR